MTMGYIRHSCEFIAVSSTAPWTKLSFDTNSPSDNHSATAGAAYEYMAIGVTSDVEIDLPQ